MPPSLQEQMGGVCIFLHLQHLTEVIASGASDDLAMVASGAMGLIFIKEKQTDPSSEASLQGNVLDATTPPTLSTWRTSPLLNMFIHQDRNTLWCRHTIALTAGGFCSL